MATNKTYPRLLMGYLSVELDDALKELARQRKIPVTKLVRDILRGYLTKGV